MFHILLVWLHQVSDAVSDVLNSYTVVIDVMRS